MVSQKELEPAEIWVNLPTSQCCNFYKYHPHITVIFVMFKPVLLRFWFDD
jgi:hypothetical protein